MIEVPFQRMSPDWGWYTCEIELKIEVLPAPLGPMMANSSPSRTSNDTESMAVTPPKRNEMSSTCSRGCASVVLARHRIGRRGRDHIGRLAQHGIGRGGRVGHDSQRLRRL